MTCCNVHLLREDKAPGWNVVDDPRQVPNQCDLQPQLLANTRGACYADTKKTTEHGVRAPWLNPSCRAGDLMILLGLVNYPVVASSWPRASSFPHFCQKYIMLSE